MLSSLAIALAVCLLAGCTQRLYRLRADKEVKYLVTQKSNDPRWDFFDFTIGMDPRARYFDPTDPDGVPMPFDDPASHRYMHCVAGRKGFPCWHMYGDWYGLENPDWKALLSKYNEVADDGSVKLTMNGAVCLARTHSSDYRTQIEQIYLSALDVSTERYRFDVQFFGNSSTIFTHTGQAQSPAGEQNTLFVGEPGQPGNISGESFGFSKEFATGGELLVGIANSFVWQFTGKDTNLATSLINFNFVQPLLQNGGRAFIMETLTRAERQLLANLRAFQRYRQGFYCLITVGNSFVGPVAGPTRVGGFFGGTGLTGFTGTGAGGIGNVAAGAFGITSSGFGGANTGGAGIGFVAGGAGSVGGFVGLLQQLQQVRNAQANLDSLVRTLGLLQANLDAGLIDIVQVDQFRQQIESTRATVLAALVAYETQLDAFKAGNLQIPPDVAVEVDDSLLRQFEFVDPRTTAVQHMIDDFVNTVGEMPEEPSPADIKRALELLGVLRSKVADQFATAHEDMKALEAKVPERKQSMSQRKAAQFDEELKKLDESLADVETRFQQTMGVLQNLEHSARTEPTGHTTDGIVALATSLSGLTQELALVKARARLETVTIPRLDITSSQALDIARANRLDWMNNRAQLVDAWRLIQFNVTQLKSGLNLTVNGGIGTLGDNAVAFNGQNGNLQMGLQFNAPFARRMQRNSYRFQLIQYQQTRRQLYQFEDGVNFNLRQLIRVLEQYEINLEIQRRAVVIAIRRVDKTREDLSKPPAPAKPTEPGKPAEPIESLGPTVAQNLIFALNDLQAAQNTFMSVVLNHYENRMLLYRELGIMELDDCGMWIDKPIKVSDWLTEDECPDPPALPDAWLTEMGIDPGDFRDIPPSKEEAVAGGFNGDAPASARAEAPKRAMTESRPRPLNVAATTAEPLSLPSPKLISSESEAKESRLKPSDDLVDRRKEPAAAAGRSSNAVRPAAAIAEEAADAEEAVDEMPILRR